LARKENKQLSDKFSSNSNFSWTFRLVNIIILPLSVRQSITDTTYTYRINGLTSLQKVLVFRFTIISLKAIMNEVYLSYK